MENEEKKCLLARMYERVPKLSRPLITVMLMSMLATGCSPTNDPNLPNNDKDPTQNEQGNEQVPENIKSYSKLLQKVLTNDEYNDIIYKHQTSQISDEALTRCIHPYGFLESKGHDIASIKNGSLECYSNTFRKSGDPSNLYILVAVESPNNYFTNYMLKYSLSKQEMNEYTDLAQSPTKDGQGFTSYQMFFMNDQISRSKTPTVISEAKISKEAYRDFHKSQYAKEYLNMHFSKDVQNHDPHFSYNIYLKNFDIENNVYEAYIIACLPSSDISFSAKDFATLTIKSGVSSYPIEESNGVLVFPNLWKYNKVLSIDSSRVYTITYYDTYPKLNKKLLIDINNFDTSLFEDNSLSP